MLRSCRILFGTSFGITPTLSAPSEPILVGAGALGTLGTLLITLSIHNEEELYKRSLLYLEQTLKLTEIAVTTLDTRKNSRVEWVKIAKLLHVAQQLATKVRDEAHHAALAGFMEDY